jgi:hypothetical protein
MIPEIYFRKIIIVDEVKFAISKALGTSIENILIVEGNKWLSVLTNPKLNSKDYLGGIYDETADFSTRLCSWKELDKEENLKFLSNLSVPLNQEVWVFDSFFTKNFEEVMLRIAGPDAYTLFIYQEPDEGGLIIGRQLSPENLSKEELAKYSTEHLSFYFLEYPAP